MSEPRIKVGVGAVIIKDGLTLLAKRKGSHGEGCYGTVGGHMEFGETAEEALKRETMEELGIEIGNIKFASCANMRKYGKHYIDISFVAEHIGGEPTIMEPHKIESIGWFPLDDLPSPLFHPVEVVLNAIRTGETFFEVSDYE